MVTRDRIRLGLGATACSAVAYAWHVERDRRRLLRADRLERIRDTARNIGEKHRVAATELRAQSSLQAPIIVSDLLAKWTSMETWSFSSLRQRIGHAIVDCGSASSDTALPFYYVCHNALSEDPDTSLYVFDCDFSEASGKSCLLADVGPLPSLAGDGVFAAGAAADHDDRPTWRWLLAGPAGSGSCLHQDPWSYSSWNASLCGYKRWVLFPPETPFAVLHPPRPESLRARGMALLASCLGVDTIPRRADEFMDEVLPSLRGRGLGEVEIVQGPGETVAFPAGWWHCVVNLTPSLAMTESFGNAARPRLHLPRAAGRRP